MSEAKARALPEGTTLAPARIPYFAADVDEVADEFQSNPATGLTGDEVQERLAKYGRNQIQVASETHWWQVLSRQFKDVLIGILFIAALVSAAVGEVTDAVTILAIILLNGTLGFIQESKAERAPRALQDMLSPRCLVLRSG